MSGLDDPLFKDPFDDSKRTPSNDPFFDDVEIDNTSPRVRRAPNQSMYVPQQPTPTYEPQPQEAESNIDSDGFYDPVEGPGYDPDSVPLYRKFEKFKQAKKKLDMFKSDADNRYRLSEMELDKFYSDTVAPAYSGYIGSEEIPDFKNDDRSQYLQEMSFQMESASKRLAEGESFFTLGKDEDYEKAKQFSSPEKLNSLANLKKQEARLIEQRDLYKKRSLNREIEHRQFRDFEASIPGIIKTQAPVWLKQAKAQAAKNKAQFADYDPYIGDVRGQGVPKRSGKKYNQWKAEYDAAQNILDSKLGDIDPTAKYVLSSLNHKARAELRETLKGVMSDREEARDFKDMGGFFSSKGMAGGHPVGMTEKERFVLDLDLLRKAGISQYKGRPINEVIEEEGGEDKITSLSVTSSVLKAHALYTELGVEAWSNWGKPGNEKRMQAKDMAFSAWQEALGRAESSGLGNDLVKRKTSQHWLGDLYRIGQALYKGSIRGYDREQGTPRNLIRILAGDGGIDDSAISKIVEAAKAELDNPRQKDTENYLKLLDSQSKDPIQAFKKLFGDDYEGSASVVMSEIFAESMGSLLPAFLKNLMDAGPYMIGASLVEALVTKKPNKTLGKVFGRNFRLGASGSFGLASFQLSYIGKVLQDLGGLGVDINNPEHFAAAWSNEEILEKMRKKAAYYAGGVAFWDTVSGLFAGRISQALSKPSQMMGLSRSGQAILNSSAEILAGSASGMLGEGTGYLLSREEGEQTPWDDIFLEGAIEFGPGSAGAVIGTGRAIFKDQKVQDAWEKNTPRKPKDLVEGEDDPKVVTPEQAPSQDGSSFHTIQSRGTNYNSLTMSPGAYDSFSTQLSENGYEMSEMEAAGVQAIFDNIIYSQESRVDAKNIHFIFNQKDGAATFRRGEKGEAIFFLNLNKIKESELGIVDAFLHESNHLAEKFLLDEGVIESFYEMLTDEQKEASILEYSNKNSSESRRKEAYEKLKNNKALARSEWLAMQMSRVLRGDDLSMEPKLKSELKKVIKILKELVKNIFSTADLAPGQKGSKERIDFEQYLLDKLNFTDRVDNTSVSTQPTPEQSPDTKSTQEPKPEPKPKPKSTQTKEGVRRKYIDSWNAFLLSVTGDLEASQTDQIDKLVSRMVKDGFSLKEITKTANQGSSLDNSSDYTAEEISNITPKNKISSQVERQIRQSFNESKPKASAETKKPALPKEKFDKAKTLVRKYTTQGKPVSEVLNRLRKATSNKYSTESYTGLINEVLSEGKEPKPKQKPAEKKPESKKPEPKKPEPKKPESKKPELETEPKPKFKKPEPKPKKKTAPKKPAPKKEESKSPVKNVEKSAYEEGKDLVAGGLSGFAAYSQVAQGRNLTKQDSEKLLNDLLKEEQNRFTDLNAPEMVGLKKPQDVDFSSTQVAVKLTQLFKLLGTGSERPLSTLSKYIVDTYIKQAVEQGFYFKAKPNQFIVENGQLRFSGNIEDYFSNQSPELDALDEYYNEVVKDRAKTFDYRNQETQGKSTFKKDPNNKDVSNMEGSPIKQSNESLEADYLEKRKALLNSLSKKNLAVSLIDPEFFKNLIESDGETLSLFNLNLQGLQSELRASINKATELKIKQDKFMSILHDFRTLFLAAKQKDSLKSTVSQYQEQVDFAFRELDNLGLLNQLEGVEKDGVSSRTSVFATIMDGVIHPSVSEKLLDGAIKLTPTEVETAEAYKMELNGGLGFDLYLNEIAKFYGIPTVQNTYPSRSDEIGSKDGSIETNVLKTADIKDIAVMSANNFISQLNQENAERSTTHYNKLKRFYYSTLNPASAFDAFGNKRSNRPNMATNKGRFIGFTKSLKSLSPEMKEFYEKNPVFSSNKGFPLVPDKFPTGEVGYKLYFFLEQYRSAQADPKYASNRPKLAGAEIFVEDEGKWYAFDGVSYEEINRDDISLDYSEHLVMAADGGYQANYHFPIRVKMEVEDIFKRTFPEESGVFGIRGPVHLGFTEVDGKPSFEILTTDENGEFAIDNFGLARNVKVIKESLNTLDNLKFIGDKRPSLSKNQKQKYESLLADPSISKEEKEGIQRAYDILKLVPFSFNGITSGSGLPNYFNNDWKSIIRNTQKEMGRIGQVDYNPTMLEIFLAYPDMPFNLVDTFEYQIKSKKESIEKQLSKEKKNERLLAKLSHEISLLEENLLQTNEAIRLFTKSGRKRKLDKGLIREFVKKVGSYEDIKRPLFSALLEDINNQFHTSLGFSDFQGMTFKEGQQRDEVSILYDMLLDLSGNKNVSFGNRFIEDIPVAFEKMDTQDPQDFRTEESKRKEDSSSGFTPTVDSTPAWFDEQSRRSKSKLNPYLSMRKETAKEREGRLKDFDPDYFIQNAEKELESVIPFMRSPIFQKYADLYASAQTDKEKRSILDEISSLPIEGVVTRQEVKAFIDRIKAVDLIRNSPNKVTLQWMNNQYNEVAAVQRFFDNSNQKELSKLKKEYLEGFFTLSEQIRVAELDAVNMESDPSYRANIDSLVKQKNAYIKAYDNLGKTKSPKAKKVEKKQAKNFYDGPEAFEIMTEILKEQERRRIHESFLRLVKLLAMGMPKSAMNARMFNLEVLRKIHALDPDNKGGLISNLWSHENLDSFYRETFPAYEKIMQEDRIGDVKESTGEDQSTVHPQDPIRRKVSSTDKSSVAYTDSSKGPVTHGDILNKYRKLASSPAGATFTESQKSAILAQHASSQLLADLGLSRRNHDDVLDSRQYVILDPESEEVAIKLDNSERASDIDEYHNALLDLQRTMSEPASLAIDDSLLSEIGVPEELIKTRPTKRDILRFIEQSNEELDIKSSESGISLDIDDYNRLAKLEVVRNGILKASDRFYEAEEKLHGAMSEEGYFITPQMLALSIWSESPLSSAAQVKKDAQKDARGGWKPTMQDNGLDEFLTADNPAAQDKELKGWIDRDTEFLSNRIYKSKDGKDNTILDILTEIAPHKENDFSVALNQYYGFLPKEPLTKAQNAILEHFKMHGIRSGIRNFKVPDSSTLDIAIQKFSALLKDASKENQLKKTRLSSYSGNAIFMNDGGNVRRRRMNLIPPETYLNFIDTLIEGAKQREFSPRKSLFLRTNTGVLDIKQNGRVIQTLTFSDNKSMERYVKNMNGIFSQTKENYKSSFVALMGLDVVSTRKQLDAKKIGDLVIYKGSLHKVELKGEDGKKVVPQGFEEIFKNKDGSYNYARLQTAFIIAFAKSDPASFYESGGVNTVSGQPIDRAGISAVARNTTSINSISPDLIDAIGTDLGAGISKNIHDDINDFESLQNQAGSTQDLDSPVVGENLSGFQKILKWIIGNQSFSDAFSRAGVEKKFRLNESIRRNLVSRVKHSLHSGIVNSYYELEEMNELMIQDLIKQGVIDPNNKADMDSVRLNQKIRLYMGKTGVEVDEAKAAYETPFMKKMSDLNVEDPLKFFGDYVYARFAKIRNKYIREKYKESPMLEGKDKEGNVLGSGMSEKEADRILNATAKHPEFNKLDSIVKDFDKMNQDTLRILVEGEVLSADQFARLKKAATNEKGEFVWAPLRGFEKEMIDDYPTGLDMIQEMVHIDEVSGAQGTGSGFSQTGGRLALTAALGRTTKANSHEIWGNAFRSNLEAVLRANKNKETSKGLLDLLTMVNKDEKLKKEWGGIFQIVRPIDLGKHSETKKVLKLSYDPDLGEDKSYFQEMEVNALELEDNVFTVRVKGEPVYILFKGETGKRISDALKNKNNFQMGPILRAFGIASGFFSSIYTVWNLDFILTNFFRDFVSGVLNLKSDQETRDIAAQIVDPRSMYGNFKGMYAVAKARRAGKSMDSVLSDSDRRFLNEVMKKDRNDVTKEELTKLFQNPAMTAIAMQKAGGKVEFFGLIDAEKKTSDIIRKLKRFQKSGKPFNSRSAGTIFFDWVNDINTGVENATRMQAFKVMVMNGATFQNAAYKGGREGTVDFNRKGNYTNVFNALFPFFGAGISGNARLIRALTSPDMGGSTEFKQRLLMKIVMGGFAYSLLMRLYAGEDEETEEQHWDRLSSWEKKHGLNIFLKPNGDGGRIVAPLPYGWNLPYGIGATLADFAVDSAGKADRKYGAFEAASEVLSSAMDTFHPMSGGTGLGRVIPHAVRPVYEVSYNSNFMGNPIRPERSPFEKGEKPDSQLYFSSVNPISKDLTNLLNRVTGGNENQSGFIDISPSTIDHTFSYFFGTMGRQVMAMSGFGYDKLKGKTPSIGSTRAIPVVSRLYKDETRNTQMQSRYYDLSKLTGSYDTHYQYLLKNGRGLEARDFYNKNKNYFKIYSLISSQKSRSSKMKRDINKRIKSGIDRSKIQPLEDRLYRERIKGMSSIIKQARTLEIYI